MVIACYYVILLSLLKSKTLKVFHKSSDDTRISEKGFSNVLSCNRSLKRAPSRLSELLKFGYCQELTWASSSSLERAFMCQTWETSLERAPARLSEHSWCSSWACSLERGPARLSDHSSWQFCRNCIFKKKSPEYKLLTHAYQPENIWNIVDSIHGNKQHKWADLIQRGNLKPNS